MKMSENELEDGVKHALNIVHGVIKTNKDEREKHVGDKVLVWDVSRLTDVETGEIEYDHLNQLLLARFESIVIETGCDHIARLTIGEKNYDKKLDLKIWSKTLNKIYRTSSTFVKLIA